ncbi:hypothetical protein ACPWT1_22600 [Ramlibacter sp. MMS24-I3-19]|uniref:hypothetical protein n=1 Tax=Ramlibacter sp. MMS24-I3-19 TaxID=3416606 RepID=UPI003D041E1F
MEVVETMLFRLEGRREWEVLREMEVPITPEQAADWLHGIHLSAAAPQLTDVEYEFLMQGAMPIDEELLGVLAAMVGPRRA